MKLASRESLSRIGIIFLGSLALFVGGFFYAQAQTPPSDLALEYVSLSGNTAVVYRNDGTAINNQAYVISFQWVDASGAALSPKQTLTRSSIASRGREILTWEDTAVEGTVIQYEQRCYKTGSIFRRRTRCDSIQVPRIVKQTLASYRMARPRPDAILAVTLDDENKITESNEGNNSAKVGNQPYRGAPPAPLAELVITRSTFDGTNLFVVIQNQSAANISNQPFDVGLQWLDQNGAAVGDKRFMRYKNLASGRVEVIDSRANLTVLQQTGTGLNDVEVAGLLSAYLAGRPTSAQKLQITVDERNQILENNEANNVATIVLPPLRLPDLAFASIGMQGSVLRIDVQNRGITFAPASELILQWLGPEGSIGEKVSTIYPIRPLIPGGSYPVTLAFNGQTPAERLLANPPPGALRLQFTIDAASKIKELSEDNNVSAIDAVALIPPLPDLAITKHVQTLTRERLMFSFINASKVPLTQFPGLSFWFEWVNEKGERIDKHLYWHDRSAASVPTGGAVSIFNSRGIYVGSAAGDFASLDSVLKNPPVNAAHLKITIDGPNRFRETDEANNTVLLSKPAAPATPPDFTVKEAKFTAEELTFTYNNTGGAHEQQLSIWFHFADSRGVQASPLYWLDVEPLSAGGERKFSSQNAVFYSQTGKSSLVDLLKVAPAGIKYFKITVDGPARIVESNELNNTALVERPIAPGQPDLVLEKAEVREEILYITVRNVGTQEAPLTNLALHWTAEEGKSLEQRADVEYWTTDPLATGAQTTIKIEINGLGNASRFLREPQKGAARLRIAVDGDQRLVESNEKNNETYLDRAQIPEPKPQPPDLMIGTAEVKDGSLNIAARNVGDEATIPTDIWLMWFAGSKALFSSAAVDLPGIVGRAETVVAVPLDGKTEASQILSDPPKDATRLRIYLDGSRKVKEANEDNNDILFDRTKLPVAAQKPELTLSLAIDIIPKAQAAASTSATAGFILAFAALLTGGFLIHAHHGTPGGARGLLSVFPLLLTSSRSSYMRLHKCGAQGCSGPNFTRHAALKKMTRASLGVALATGVVKIGIMFALSGTVGPTELVSAAMPEVSYGDGVRVTMVAKNTGKVPITGMMLRLPCPSGTSWTNTRLDERDLGVRKADQGFEAHDLNPGASHRLAVICKIEESVLKSIRFVGDAQYKETGDRRWYSNVIEVAVSKRTEVPVEKPDLTVEGLGFLPLLDVVEADQEPLPAMFSAVVKNNGKREAGRFLSRVRLDAGSDGSWDFVSPSGGQVLSLAPGADTFVQIPYEWRAPVGGYTFEVCVDPGNSVDEASEGNNCAKDRFTVKIGEEPAQEEEIVE